MTHDTRLPCWTELATLAKEHRGTRANDRRPTFSLPTRAAAFDGRLASSRRPAGDITAHGDLAIQTSTKRDGKHETPNYVSVITESRLGSKGGGIHPPGPPPTNRARPSAATVQERI